MIVALMVALVGPFFVDWNAYRSTFESYAERALGHSVTVLGRADARLLPTPTLVFSDVRVGEAEDPLMVVSRFEVRIELTPLLNGEIRVVDMRLEQPELHLALDESGRLDWLTAATLHNGSQIDPANVQLDSVDIQNGSVEVIDARTGSIHTVSDVNLNLSARSLQGPYKLEGALALNGARQSVRVSTGRQDADGKIRVKAEFVPTEVPVTLRLDGLLGDSNGAPEYVGDFVLASVAQVETPEGEDDITFNGGQLSRQAAQLWEGEGKFELTPVQLDISELAFRYGREDRPFRLDGDGTVLFGAAPRFDARITAKQVDLDRIFGAGPKDPLAIDQAAASLLASLKNLPLPPIPGAIGLSLPGLVAGGGIIQDIELNAETLPRGWRISSLEAQLPGRSEFSASGELRLGETPDFEGKMHLASSQPSAFAAWWRKGQPARPLSLDPFSVDARVEISPTALLLTGLEGDVGSSAFTGAVTWRKLTGSDRSVVTADLDADRLDVDQLQALASLLRGAGGDAEGRDAAAEQQAGKFGKTDVSVRMAIADLRVSGTRADRVELIASYAQDALNVERFQAANFAGARVEAEGRVNALTTAPDGQFTATLEAETLDELRDVLVRLFPDVDAVRQFAAASPALAPAKLTANFSARAGVSGGSKAALTLNGQMGGSTLEAKADFSGRTDAWRDAEVDVEAHVRASDGLEMLRQFTFDVLPIDGVGPARLDVTASGDVESGLSVGLVASGIGSEFEAQGSVGFPASKPVLYGFDVVARSDDLTPFGLMSGRVLPILAGAVPLQASARLDGEALAMTLSDIDARVGAVTLTGSVEGDFAQRAQLTGAVRVSSVDAGLLSELVLGADAWSSVNAAAENRQGWPSGAFGAPFLGDLSLRLDVTADKADLGLPKLAERATFSLQASNSELAVDGFDAAFEGGRLSGSLLINRSGGEAAASGTVKASAVDLEGLVWRRAGRPLARGLLDLSVDFEGAGRSVSGIVAGLAGGGTFHVGNGELRGISTAAFGSVIRAADAGLALEDAAIRKVFLSHLDAGNLPFKALDGSLTLAAGTVRARNVTVDTDRAKAFGTATIDLERWELESDWALKVDPGENAVTGAEPQVGLLFRGPLDDPSRSIDIAPLTAFLTLRAFEQEVRRVENLQEEILERDRFLRQLRRQREERSRARQKADEQAAAGNAEREQGSDADEARGPRRNPRRKAATALPMRNPGQGGSMSRISPGAFVRPSSRRCR
ncbi:AsmA family protein [Breoghania sp. L-A4]|uniref:AsmA family protein n=1 Tax=Breoghania sp. L-A4 TaxID=2304600 RepID=UPI000E35C6DA|nr:AsmA family protein [Breoghania sp. L-A4]AXS41310.1 AsmA family protein [Breoghania sp. L-A4]